MAKPTKTKPRAKSNSGIKPQGSGVKNSNTLAKSKTKTEASLSVWVWVLIVIVVAVGGFWIIKLTNQRSVVEHYLPAEISVAEAANLDPEEWFFLDVREQSEWNEGHIEWATLIPLGQLAARKDELPKDKKIVVVCRSGNRSAQGRDILLKAGFNEVTSMSGGMNDWGRLENLVVTGP